MSSRRPSRHPFFTLLRSIFLGLGVFALGFIGFTYLQADEPAKIGDPPGFRAAANKDFSDGNFQEAFNKFKRLLLETKDAPNMLCDDLRKAVQCLNNLNRTNELDAFLEEVVKAQESQWLVLRQVALEYQGLPHFGFMIAGEFERGHHRGGGKQAGSFERDRHRALQLFVQAMNMSKEDDNTADRAALCLDMSRLFMMGRQGQQDAWRLQYLTNLDETPDFEEAYWGWGYHGGQTQGAPVDADGNPVFHKIPASFEDAKTDGERWRWCLVEAVELNPGLASTVRYDFAQFLWNQFGVQTLAQYGYWGAPQAEEGADTGTYALHTLKENETIARLATGVKRFELPDEFNYILIYKDLAAGDPQAGAAFAVEACRNLAQEFQNRRQYPRATECWRQVLTKVRSGDWRWTEATNAIAQIEDKWGRFDNVLNQAAGQGASVDFRFRNGKQVEFEAFEIKVALLLEDVKDYIKTKPRNLDWEKMNINDIGQRVVWHNQTKYIGEKVANWSLDLEPRPNHFDKRITVSTPLQKAGAYLLVAKMKDGNTSRIIIWLEDTVIVKKPLAEKVLFYVADARSGAPLAKTNVEFFGYWHEWKQRNTYELHIKNFAESTDDAGLITLDNTQMPNNHQWLIVARPDQTRLAYIGFTGVWFPNYYDQEYNATKVFFITDRPVYRPNQKALFKAWVRHAKYDQEDSSSFAGADLKLEIRNPSGDIVFEKREKADEYGGLAGEYEIPEGAPLGVYSIAIENHGGSSFRVEEYKKPEFEVKIESPTEPVMLGEKIKVGVKADYYFGEPVRKGTMKYKVLRHSQSAQWHPVGPWDWFYGRGYWWFAYDYDWYPGWGKWGICRPFPYWWSRAEPQPELVMENEIPIPEDGKLEIEIDTAMAKEMHGNTDHRYEITAEVTDQSRRVIVGNGSVLVAREPFKVYTWLERGHYRVGDTIRASFSAQTLDNKPVGGKSEIKLWRVEYDSEAKPKESLAQTWEMEMKVEGTNELQFAASRPGQYRLSRMVTDAKGNTREGAYVFTIGGEGFDGRDYRFNDIEIIPDKREYAPGEKVQLQINTNKLGGTVLLFTRPANGVYLAPEVIRLDGKSALREIEVSKKDMPNFFVEAVTIADGRLHVESREIVVPPEKRVLNLEVLPSATEYKPGEKATVDLKLTDHEGKPVVGSAVLTVYDKAVEYISGGSNVPDIKEFFWKWRRNHHPNTESNLGRWFYTLLKENETGMNDLGIFGGGVVNEIAESQAMLGFAGGAMDGRGGMEMRRESRPMAAMAPSRMMKSAAKEEGMLMADMAVSEVASGPADADAEPMAGESGAVQPVVRTQFADTAFWTTAVLTDADGHARVEFDMPENLTGWKVKSWAMTHGTKVGEGDATVVTKKNLMIRMQAPRFFVEKDEVVLSCNVHNYLKNAKKVEVILDLMGPELVPATGDHKPFRYSKPDEKPELVGTRLVQTIEVEAGGERRVDWRVKAVREGEARVRMSALTDEESDAMEMKYPVNVHGMSKMVSWSGYIKPDAESATIEIEVPAERRINESRLEIRYSPTLAGAMVDALPYLVDYPYGCTEQTLSRFLPTAITHKVLGDMGLDLKAIEQKRSNLNAQEIGDDKERAKQWKRYRNPDGSFKNPVFDAEEVNRMVKEGVAALTEMQLGDGGWGWFSGWGEHSWPHTTAYVVHGLQTAMASDVAIVPSTLERGVAWLKNYQQQELQKLQNWEKSKDKEKPIRPYKTQADNLDAFVYMVLADASIELEEMREFIYRDRNHLSVYAKAMFGIGLQRHFERQPVAGVPKAEPYMAKRDMIIQNIEQFLVRDDENQTAYLRLENEGYWWYWYGSEYEAQGYYLKLLAATKQHDDWRAPYLVKYLLNNRKHATYWNSTRDTSIIVEAFADYLRVSGEMKPDLTVEVLVNGKVMQEAKINAENLFVYDNKFVLFGDAVETGKHKIEIRKKGKGPIYFNAYLSYFSLEDFITKAGLEVKVERRFFKLEREDKSVKVAGSRGQALDQKVEKYVRVLIDNNAELESGQLVEVELVIESKNDYEYLVFEDMKAAGFEPVDVRSGYTGNEMGAYVEFRDNRVAFFVNNLARGKHSVSYRLRAEIPGRFSALPAHGYAMYAPELRGNSDEMKIAVEDKK